MEQQELADQPTSKPTNPHSPIISNPSNLNFPEIVQSKHTRFKIVTPLRDFQTVLENLWKNVPLFQNFICNVGLFKQKNN